MEGTPSSAPRGRGVFIAYRHEAWGAARLVHDHLRRRGFDVFRDRDLPNGLFEGPLREEIDARRHFVVILDRTTRFEPERSAEDWLRWEIALALEKERAIVPVLVDGVTFASLALPEDIADLAGYNAVTLRDDNCDTALPKVLPTATTRRPFLLAALALLVAAVVATGVLIQTGTLTPGPSPSIMQAFAGAGATSCSRDAGAAPGDVAVATCPGVGGVTTTYHQLGAGTGQEAVRTNRAAQTMASVVSGCGVSYTGLAPSNGPGGTTLVPVRLNVYPSAYYFQVTGPVGAAPTSLPVPTVNASVVCPPR